MIKFKFLLELVKHKEYHDQIMISNNINFKCQLKRFGGNGYSELFKIYKDKIITYSELEENSINNIFKKNLTDLICWWEPPRLSEKTVKTISCQL